MKVLLEENPLGGSTMYFDEFGNPMRRKRARRRRNPLNSLAGVGAIRGWTQGVDLIDIAAGVGGMAAAAMIPGTVVKTAETGGQKFLKVIVAVGCALGAGFLAKTAISPSAGKAAIIGGLAGTGIQVIGMVTGLKLGSPVGLLSSGRRIGFQETISPSFTREGETVQLIQP